jgi:hypothetical protein
MSGCRPELVSARAPAPSGTRPPCPGCLAQAIRRRRRNQPSRPTLAKIRPGRPAAAIGPGTPEISVGPVHAPGVPLRLNPNVSVKTHWSNCDVESKGGRDLVKMARATGILADLDLPGSMQDRRRSKLRRFHGACPFNAGSGRTSTLGAATGGKRHAELRFHGSHPLLKAAAAITSMVSHRTPPSMLLDNPRFFWTTDGYGPEKRALRSAR